ncbi:S-adenosyl-L-methionine-dependent methyltransferase [Colletotrichum cereale]|nr:S-adenosyl-L-methionine-dependent methyltransferase [Colletotrichum cereale]
MHLAWKSLLNEKLAQCPKESGAKRVLDIGTGNGCWAIEYGMCPTNCRLEVADIEEDWPWQGSFDFIFVRNMGGAIKNWARLLSKAYNALESGGWLEFQEHSYSFEDNSKSQGSGAIEEWCELLHRSMSDHGRPMSVGSKMVEMMSNAGISVIKNVVWRVAARPCPPTASARQRHKKGRRCLSLEDLSLGPFTRYHGLDANEVRLMCMTVRKQLRSEDNDGSWLL